MKQSWQRREYSEKVWREYYTPYPNEPPYSVRPVIQNWSQDLHISGRHLHSMLGETHQDIGGPFYCTRRIYDESSTLGENPVTVPHPWSTDYGVYVTPQFAFKSDFDNDDFPTVVPTSGIELMALGREAIARTIPTKSSFDGATFIGELREGLPSIIPFGQSGRSRALASKNAGDEYLNVEFGWKPLLRDFHSFRNAVENAESILDEYEKGSGKLHRVKYTFPTTFDQTVETGEGLAVPLISQTNLWEPGGYLGTLRITTTTRVRRWFSGAFTYWFPKRGDSLRKTAELKKLYGLEISPDMLWNVAPWSWAADWAGDAGILAENITNMGRDNLLMPWAYLMEEKSVKKEYQLSGLRYRAFPGEQILRQSFETIAKSRIQASPYGFDLDWPDFSPRQVAIAGALGISRGS